jgi:two-component system nitrate/nitrite sensor histidine kinase NarX
LTNDLRSRLEEFERASGITAHLAATGEWTPAVRRVKQLVHGIVDEALTNVRKHAQARTVLVSLRYDDDRLTVVVQDDGLGAPDVVLDAIPQSYLHFGLRHIHDMVRERGGLFTATNGEESGLVVSVELPLGPGLS